MPLPSLQYYDDLYNKRKANKPVAQIDGLDREIARMRSNEIKENLFLSASPDTVARVNRIARETGELPLLIEDRINDYEKSLVNSKFMQVADDNPGIAKWAVNNPRAAAAAADDAFSLAKFGAAFSKLKDDFAKDGGWLEQGGDFIERRAYGLKSGFDRFTVATERFFENLTPPAQRSEAAKRNTQVVVSRARQSAEFGEAVQALPIRNEILWQEVKKNPNASNVATFIRQQGFASIPDMALAVASLPLYTAGRSGEIGQERAKNNNRSEATFGDVATAAPFAALSGYLDRLGFTKMVMPGSGTVVGRIGGAVVTEGATEFAQEIIDYGGATLGTDAGFQFSQALDAGVAGAVAGAGIGGTVRTTVESPQIVRALSSAVSNAMKSDAAKAEAAFLDELAKATEGSKLKERDTEAFREMIRSLADENDIKTVYISGEALQEYMQSESFDAEGPLSRWTAEVEEAAALGGDVVMPIEEAMAVLPGTPAWQALRDDMRLSPGGISRKEAQTFDEAMADVMDELARTMAEQEKATAKKLEPIEKLSQSIAQKLQNVGFTPSAADTQARLLVQRYATRAERLGRELTGDEFGVTINQVLPEGIAQARAADNLDLVINSYFTMKKPKEQTGKSLVEWIASRGGITDEGGDLAAMGLGDWHKQKAFRKKVIRQSDKNQGNMLGAVSNDYSPNRILEAAIDEGYFPELQGTEEALDLNALLTAIEEELQGRPRYAQERIVDDVQQLAVQLDEFLSQSGFDPANMTREEMRAAIMQAQGGGGKQLSEMTVAELEAELEALIDPLDYEAAALRNKGETQGDLWEAISTATSGFGVLSEVNGEPNAVSAIQAAQRVGRPDIEKAILVRAHLEAKRAQEVKPQLAPDSPRYEGAKTALAAQAERASQSLAKVVQVANVEPANVYEQLPDTIEIDGVERPTRNSNGQPLAQTEEGVRNFWNWFGDSKVVDAQGRPLVVYHGAPDARDIVNENGSFKSFEERFGGEGDGAHWFAASRATAATYADDRRAFDYQAAEPAIVEAYLKIENPLEENGMGKEWREAQARGKTRDIIDDAKDGGHDGVILRNVKDDYQTQRNRPTDTYVAFKGTQIKSVNNRGTFDPADARILFQDIGSPREQGFKRWAGDAEIVRSGEALSYDFETGRAVVVEAFHGTQRPDRVGEAFQKDRATAGPMAYFTASPELASRYSESKSDTSIPEEESDYARWFKIKIDGEQVPLSEAWDRLPAQERVKIRKLAPRVKLDEETAENIELGPEGETRGVGSYDWALRQNRNNPLAALVDSWLYSGALFNEESRFLEVLKLAGLPMKGVVFDDPSASYSSVFPVWIKMQKPLFVGDIPAEVEQALQEVAASDDSEPVEGLGYAWDKRTTTPREWVEQYNNPDQRTFVWTKIPDAITDVFRQFGYDGIVDYSGKGGGTEMAPVYIPFDEPQVKSRFNQGAFNPNDSRILFQSAYHGSPHIFDKFSLDAIGSGEGAQAFGWGLYFAGRKEIAEHYRKALVRQKAVVKWRGKSVQEMSDALGDVFEDAANWDAVGAMTAVETYGTVEDAIAKYKSSPVAADRDVAAWLEANGAELEIEAAGRLYQVDIPEDNEYLLWDAPLSEQPGEVWDQVIDAVQRQMGDPQGPELAAMFELGDVTGQEAYNWIAATFERGEVPDGVRGTPSGQSARMASEILKDAGIAGIKYLDGGSRSSGDGSYNYVVFDDSRVSIQAYEQSYGEGPRGRITFNSGQATIDLFQNRNLSTFLHEVGHLWLEELRFDAEMPDAPEQLKADWQKVQDWFASQGHKVENGFIPVEAHEMWARGVERYLMEGKAPNSALKRAFETFRAWLTAIYKVVDALKSPITPEIRGVMDRLIATDEQLQDYAEQQRIAALFKTAADAGMTGAEFAEYQRQTEEARTEANSKLIEKTMRSIRARETKRYKEAEATVREEITADVDARPLFKALRLLKASPMDEKWIRSEMGEDSLSLLPRRVPPTYKTGGVHPDVIAEQSGFASGKAMVEALMGAGIAHRQAVEGGDKRSMRERTIAGEVDAIMQARYGDPLNDGTIEREALEAVHNEMQGEVIAAEIRVLARRTGRRPTPYAIARDWARNKIRQGVVSVEASPSAIQRYARAAAKAATKAQEAMLAQDVEEAFRQKQAQMVNNALVAEAKAAADEVEKAVKRMEKIAKRKTIKSVDQGYLEQAQALLENVDLRRRSQVGINRQNQFEAWAQEQQAAGHDVPVPPSFEQTLGKTNWTRLSVENLLSLDETIKHIMHLGRLKQTLLDNKERRDFDELVKEATDSAGNLRQRPPSDLMAPSYWDGIKSKILAADAALLKMETVFDWLDGNNPNGVFNRIVFRPIADAQEAERLKLQEYIEKLTDALKAVPKEVLARWGDKVTTGLLNRETGRPFIFTRDMLVSMALNVGNQSNLDKLAGGYGWNESEILATLASNLTEAEWQYVQSVWDTIDSLWPEIEAMEKRINGVAPEKIEARPVETRFGTLRGGYFPVVYDPARNYDAEANAAKGRDLFETIYTRATTPKGFTKERTNVERPIHLSLGIINRHVAEVIHDLTHREAIMQADKFLSDKRVMKAVDDTLGPEVRRQFRPWLQRIANEWAYDRAGNAGAEKFLRTLRANATIVGMGFRLSTILMQAAGYSNSFERVGFKWVARRIKDVANPAAYEFVLSKSAEVAGRMDNLDRDIRDNVKSAMGKTDWLTAPKRFAFHGIAYMDRMVVIPTWLGAYDKAIAEGMADEDAVYAADKAVRQSQGSGAAKDLSAIQSGRGPAGEALKLMTMFYSYMSAFYQRQRSLGRDTRNGSVKDMPALLARAWWLIVVPPVLAELLAGRGPGEDDDEALWAFEKMMLALVGPIPLARDIAPIALARAKDDPTFGYKFTPVSGAGQSLINVVSDVSNVIEGEETKRATRNMIEAVGYFTGLTTGQMAAAAQFLVDVGYGEQDPQDFSDWWEGLNTGKIKEE